MRLYIDSQFATLVIIASKGGYTIGADDTVFEITDDEQLIALLPVCFGGETPFPVTAQLVCGKLIGENAFIRAVDWGGNIIEIVVDFPKRRADTEKPALIEKLVYKSRDGKNFAAELYRDNGLRLGVFDGRGERGYWLSSAAEGEMRLLDVGGENLLVIHAKEETRETLIAVNGALEEAAKIEGRYCGIDDGYFTAVTPLNTVLGHETRTRYEFASGELKKLPDETGFFTQSPQKPGDAFETALALVQAAQLGRADELRLFLSEELYKSFTLAELREFFGEFDECRMAPWQTREKSESERHEHEFACSLEYEDEKRRGEKDKNENKEASGKESKEENEEENVVLGMVLNGKARRFLFTVWRGAVTDVAAE